MCPSNPIFWLHKYPFTLPAGVKTALGLSTSFLPPQDTLKVFPTQFQVQDLRNHKLFMEQRVEQVRRLAEQKEQGSEAAWDDKQLMRLTYEA